MACKTQEIQNHLTGTLKMIQGFFLIDVNYCFTCGESNLYYNVAKSQNIIHKLLYL